MAPTETEQHGNGGHHRA